MRALLSPASSFGGLLEFPSQDGARAWWVTSRIYPQLYFSCAPDRERKVSFGSARSGYPPFSSFASSSSSSSLPPSPAFFFNSFFHSAFLLPCKGNVLTHWVFSFAFLSAGQSGRAELIVDSSGLAAPALSVLYTFCFGRFGWMKERGLITSCSSLLW